MNMLTIDCTQLHDRAQLHRALAETLCFPDWYGHNLDALYDCLSEIAASTVLCLKGWSTLGDWAQGFAETLTDASQENPCLLVLFE